MNIGLEGFLYITSSGWTTISFESFRVEKADFLRKFVIKWTTSNAFHHDDGEFCTANAHEDIHPMHPSRNISFFDECKKMCYTSFRRVSSVVWKRWIFITSVAHCNGNFDH